MADRDSRLLLVLLGVPGVERGAVGWGRLGTLLGPEGTGASLLLQATMVVGVLLGAPGPASPGWEGWWLRITVTRGCVPGERGVARSLRTAQWTRASL
jgi:hypothetical protein